MFSDFFSIDSKNFPDEKPIKKEINIHTSVNDELIVLSFSNMLINPAFNPIIKSKVKQTEKIGLIIKYRIVPKVFREPSFCIVKLELRSILYIFLI